MNLNTPIRDLSRVGKTTAARLQRLGVETAGDLLYYFPFRYDDFSKITPIGDLKEGETCTVKGKVELLTNKRAPRWRKIVTEGLISDASGSLRVVWFNQPFITKLLAVGDEVYLSGKVKTDVLGEQMVSPVYEKANKTSTTHTARLVPIYPLTAGVTEKQMRFLASQVVGLAKEIPEWLQPEILEKYDLAPLADALHGIHFPVDFTDLKKCTERLKFDELFLLQLKAILAREERSSLHSPPLTFREEEIKDFVKNLPFILTKTQKLSAWEILQDIAKPQPMNRLLSGDVGSGKTVVAAMAALNTVLNGFQAVLMAPTEILASQHYESLVKLLGDKVNIAILTHSQFQISNLKFQIKSQILNAKLQKKELLQKIEDGTIQIIVGTHALLSEGVEFKKLGLVVVDEQHRFGVEQRKTIKDKGREAHFLSMTATPIPRSLALVLYGDLEISIINELPPGRKKIITRLVESFNRKKAYDFIESQVKTGRQVFVICPLIEQVEEEKTFGVKDERKTVMSEYKKLSEEIFPKLKVGYLHGKMKGAEKEEIMGKFKNRELDILVATSVVEVGVDIPNASVMMIEGAERFGLAQLHQFRGRVGRSVHQSYCFLFTENLFGRAKERLKFFETENNGFKLAEKDLEIRGPGEVYGTAQSGMMNLRLAKLTDQNIIKKAREAAKSVLPDISKFPALMKKIKEWEDSVHLE